MITSKEEIDKNLKTIPIEYCDLVQQIVFQQQSTDWGHTIYTYGEIYSNNVETAIELINDRYQKLEIRLFNEVLFGNQIDPQNICELVIIKKDISKPFSSINIECDNQQYIITISYNNDDKICTIWNEIINSRRELATNKQKIDRLLLCIFNYAFNARIHEKGLIDNLQSFLENNLDKFRQSIKIGKGFLGREQYAVKLFFSSLLFSWKTIFYSKIIDDYKSFAGGLVICFKKNISKDDILAKLILTKVQLLGTTLLWFNKNILYRKESIKSAKAAIMARNISHNLGSHVMAYLKNKLGSVSDIVKQRALVELATTESISDLQNALKKYGTDALFSENIEFPFLVGLGYFISYLQEREDYIATVSTSYIPYYMSVNFKDSIYDALNPDLRYLRHQGRQGGKPDNILLSYIAKSEGFERPPYLNYKSYLDKNLNEKEKAELQSLDQSSRKNDIIIKFKKFDGINDKTYTDFVNGNIKIQVRSENGKGSGYLSLKEMRNYHIGLPGGISGRQALFSILENIIRNAAKHGNFHEVENLAITLDILDPLSAKDKNTCAKLWKKEPEDLDKLVDINDIYVMTITDNLKISQDKFEKLLEVLQDKYVNENGEMNNRAKGLKEMRISAAYIRRIEDEEKAEQEHRAPIINITLTEEQNLQYIICLPKAFKAAIILPNNDERIGKIQDKGNITFMSAESFKKSYNRCYDIIAIKKNDTTSFENICLSSPQRIIKAEDEELNKIKQIKDLSILYKQLVKEKETIYIMDHLFKKLDNLKAVEKVMNMTNFHNKCLYQKHLENEKEFKGFINILTLENVGNKSLSQNPRPKFAEGISGSNSTDRLIRNDIIDELWYYKHLHAMQTQIAIFDERLFYHVSGLDDKLLLEQEVHSGDYQAVISAFKNVYIFNILFNDVNGQQRFDIYGYEDYDYTEEKISSVIKCIAHITFDNKTLKLDIINPKYKKSFNNISIHQGLLDKIYHQWNIDNNKAKDEVTNTLYDGFMTTDNSVIQLTVDDNDNKKVNKQFYPGMTIHSGRSKPSPQDMPQLIPFIQYASIENAFMDCKYILVELLELAQYE